MRRPIPRRRPINPIAGEAPQVSRAHEDLLALLDAAAAGRADATHPGADEPQLIPALDQGQTRFLPVVQASTRTIHNVVAPARAALLTTQDPSSDRVHVGATSLAEAIGRVMKASPGLRYADVLEHLEV